MRTGSTAFGRTAVARAAVCAAAAAAAVLCTSSSSHAFSWAANASGNFNDGTRWTGGIAPSTTSHTADFVVSPSGAYTVTFTNSPSISATAVGNNNNVTFVSNGTPQTFTSTQLSVASLGAVLTLGGDGVAPLHFNPAQIAVNNGGIVNINAGNDLATGLTNVASLGSGTMNVDGAGSSFSSSATTNIVNASNATGSATFSNSAAGSFNILNVGNFATSNSTALLNVQSGADVTSSGVIRIGTGGASGLTGTVTVTGAGSTYVQSGASGINIGAASNSTGTLNVSSGGSFTTGTGTTTINATGMISVNGGTFIANGLVSVVGAGTLQSSSTGMIQVGSGGTTGSINGNVTNNGSLVFNRSNAVNQSGVVSGTGSVNQAGAGTLTLTGINTYTGGTTISGGTLSVAADSNLGGAAGGIAFKNAATLSSTATLTTARPVTLDGSSGGGTLNVAGGTTLTLSGVIGGAAGSLTKTGTGTLTFDGTTANTYTGSTFVDGGTLRLAKTSSGTDSIAGGTLTIGTGTEGPVEDFVVIAYPDSLGANVAVVINGSGQLDGGDFVTAFNGGLAMTGGGIINANLHVAGGNVVTNASAVSSTISGSSGLDFAGGTRTFNIADGAAAEDMVISAPLKNGAVLKAGAGTMVLSGNNVYAGGTTINSGTLSVDADHRLGAGTVGVAFSNAAALAASASFTMNRPVTLGSGGGTFDVPAATTLTVERVISGGGQLIKRGDGVLILSAANTYTGGTTIDAGAVSVPGNTLGGPGTSVLLNDLATLATTATFGLTRELVMGANGGGTIDVAPFTNLTVQAAMTGPGGLTKTGDGTLILSSSHFYGGGTTLNGGTVSLGTDGDFGGSAPLTFNNGATLETSSKNLARPVTLGSGGGTFTVNPGGTLTLSGVVSGPGGLVKTGQGTLVLGGTIANTFTGDAVVNQGTLRLNKGPGTNAIGGNLIIGDDIGGPSADIAITTNSGVPDTSTVTVNSSGQFQVSSADQISGLVIQGGSVTIASGGAFLGLLGGLTTLAQGNEATISGTGPLRFPNPSTLNIANGFAVNDLLISTTIDGPGGFDKQGPGTLVLAANHTVPFPITISAGTLQIGSGAASGSITGNVTNNANFAFNRSNDATYGGSISGNGSLTKAGAGVLTLDGANTYVGSTTVNSGTLVFNTSYTSGSSLHVAGGAAARLAPGGGTLLRTGSLTIGGVLAMNDNDFIVNYAAGDPSPEFTLRDKVKAFVDSQAPGAPAFTSGISFIPGAGDRVIAIAEKTEWGQSTFNGFTLDNTTVIGKYTYYGDANLDGKVDSNDYVAVDVGLGNGDSWVQGDFNFSGTVTSDDYVAIDTNLGKGVTVGDPLAIAELKAEMIALHTAMFGDTYVQQLAWAEAHGYAATIVPEPGVAAALAAMTCTLLARRRRSAV